MKPWNAPLEHKTLDTKPLHTQGFLEYWSARSYEAPGHEAVSFSSKLDTDLFDVAKAKAVARSIEVR